MPAAEGIAGIHRCGLPRIAGQTSAQAEMVKAVAAQADKLVLTADSTKHGRRGFALMFPLTRLDLLITDKGLSEPARQELREAGLQLITV